jgi:hypothetical protein
MLFGEQRGGFFFPLCLQTPLFIEVGPQGQESFKPLVDISVSMGFAIKLAVSHLMMSSSLFHSKSAVVCISVFISIHGGHDFKCLITLLASWLLTAFCRST